MHGKQEKARCRAIVQEMSDRARATEEAARPIGREDLRALFDHLDDVVGREGCDNTLRRTRAFLQARLLDEAVIVPWLGEYGGYRDCEVLANVGERWDGEETSWDLQGPRG